MTALEKIYKELSERFKDEPNKNLILGYTMGVIEKHKLEIINEGFDMVAKMKEEINTELENLTK